MAVLRSCAVDCNIWTVWNHRQRSRCLDHCQASSSIDIYVILCIEDYVNMLLAYLIIGKHLF